jgi:hypothetical protein
MQKYYVTAGMDRTNTADHASHGFLRNMLTFIFILKAVDQSVPADYVAMLGVFYHQHYYFNNKRGTCMDAWCSVPPCFHCFSYDVKRERNL